MTDQSIKNLSLSNEGQNDVTILSNLFIDLYMPRANGEFVKIYLYFLRACSKSDKKMTLESAANDLFLTEGDVLRALKYWESEGLLALSFQSEELKGITFLSIQEVGQAKPATLKEDSVQQLCSQNFATEDDQNDFWIIEQIYGRPISQTMTNDILYFKEELHFNSDLLYYLFEFCVSNNHKSASYIRKVALDWHAHGIDTEEKARIYCGHYIRDAKDAYQILKALGINGRDPTPSEMEYIDRWRYEYGFPLSLILEACKRSTERNYSNVFKSTQTILENWYKNHVGSMEDVYRLDRAHTADQKTQKLNSSERNAAKANTQTDASSQKYPNRFHNFEERSYDYQKLEQTLLKKSMQADADSYTNTNEKKSDPDTGR